MSSLFEFLATIFKTLIGYNFLKIFFLFLGFAENLYIFLKIAYIVILIIYTVIAFPLIIENLKISIENKKLKKQ